MKITYDPDANAVAITLGQAPADGSITATLPGAVPEGSEAEINLDFDSNGHLRVIEILGARSVLTEATLQHADPA